MNDLINRQAVIDALEEERKYLLAKGQYGAEDVLVHHALNIIDDLPSIEPERKKGHNICDQVRGWHCEFKCSLCDADIGVVEYGSMDGGKFNFCPNCGAELSQ